MDEPNILLKLSDEEANKIYDELKDRGHELYLITEWGAAGIIEKAKYVLELGKDRDDNWFGNISFVDSSDDGVFVRLRKEEFMDKLPNFKDVFKIVKL